MNIYQLIISFVQRGHCCHLHLISRVVSLVTSSGSYQEEFYTLLLDASHTAGCSLDSGQRWRYHSGTRQRPLLQCSRVWLLFLSRNATHLLTSFTMFVNMHDKTSDGILTLNMSKTLSTEHHLTWSCVIVCHTYVPSGHLHSCVPVDIRQQAQAETLGVWWISESIHCQWGLRGVERLPHTLVQLIVSYRAPEGWLRISHRLQVYSRRSRQ